MMNSVPFHQSLKIQSKFIRAHSQGNIMNFIDDSRSWMKEKYTSVGWEFILKIFQDGRIFSYLLILFVRRNRSLIERILFQWQIGSATIPYFDNESPVSYRHLLEFPLKWNFYTQMPMTYFTFCRCFIACNMKLKRQMITFPNPIEAILCNFFNLNEQQQEYNSIYCTYVCLMYISVPKKKKRKLFLSDNFYENSWRWNL